MFIYLQNVTNDDASGKLVERMYCLHLFHHSCLDDYMKKPPFTGMSNFCKKYFRAIPFYKCIGGKKFKKMK